MPVLSAITVNMYYMMAGIVYAAYLGGINPMQALMMILNMMNGGHCWGCGGGMRYGRHGGGWYAPAIT